MQVFFDGYREFLDKRSMTRPNGQMLFHYRASKAEYLSLRELFSNRLAVLNGRAWKLTSFAECSLFVLYASEWWRREYAGGPWRWTRIFESLTCGPYNIDVLERTDAVERGLRAWGHRPSAEGRRYLGAIVAQGGLPLQMLAQGDGAITRLLIRGMRQAQLLGWDEIQLELFFEVHSMELVQHLRAPELYQLLACVVITVLKLRKECQLAGIANPVEVLDLTQPNWRERFPIAVDDRAAEPLLVGLVREAAKEIKPVTLYPASIIRTLVMLSDGESYQLAMSVQMPASISQLALSSALGVTAESLPQSFTLELMRNERQLLGQGRQLLGTKEATVMLTGKPRRFTGEAARRECLIVLRGLGTDIYAPSPIPGGEALEDDQPWVFATRDGSFQLVGVGSCKIRDGAGLVVAPESFKVEALVGASVVLIGLTEGLSNHRWIYEVRGSISVTSDDESYLIKTAQPTADAVQLLWKGARFNYRCSPFPVFMGAPSLFRLDTEGALTRVQARDIEWVFPVKGGAVLENTSLHRGPIDAWVKENGVRQRRFRMALISPDARVRFSSGSTEREGEIDFKGWGINALNVAGSMVADTSVQPEIAKLSLKASDRPPANVVVSMSWPRSGQVLQTELPFPSTGGRFSQIDGQILTDGISLPMRKLHTVRLQVFDRNPNAPKRYSLSIELKTESQNSDKHHYRVEVSVPLDQEGFGEIRLFEIESSLNGLMCQSDGLDAQLALSLCVGQTSLRKLYLSRYDAELEQDSDSLVISKAVLESIQVAVLTGIELRAIPLLEVNCQEIKLEQNQSHGVLVGRWDTTILPTKHCPWLVYPAVDSSLQLRPTLFATSSFDNLSVMLDLACPLAVAMSNTLQRDREKAISKVAAEMALDLDHSSWKLITRQNQFLSHLPLSTLDYWRVFSWSHKASLAVVLQLSSNIDGLMYRMRHELGVIWELTPKKVLADALKSLTKSWAKQLNVEPDNAVVQQIVCSTFRKLGTFSESFAEQIDLVLFEGGFDRGKHLDRLLTSFKKSPIEILHELWSGQDCVLQRVLLRAHADNHIWPHFNLTESLVEALMKECLTKDAESLMRLGKDLLWLQATTPSGPQSKNIKQDVANVPLLLGLLTQLTESSDWWRANGRMSQIREIRTFDPVWFELGIRTGNLLAMKTRDSYASAPRVQPASTGGIRIPKKQF